MLRCVSGLSARARAPSRGICCVESRENPLARGHLPKGHAAGSRRTIRTCQRTFQGGMLHGVLGVSARARAPSKEICCGESLDNPLTRGHLPKGQATVGLRAICSRQRNFQRDLLRSLGNTRSRQGAFQRSMLRGFLGLSARARSSSKGTCCSQSQDYPPAPAHFPQGHAAGSPRNISPRQVAFTHGSAAGSLRAIRSLQRSFQRDMLRGVPEQSPCERSSFQVT